MNPYIHAMVDGRKRLQILKDLSIRTKELGTITLKSPELWEPEDQSALDQLDAAIAHAQGAVALFDSEMTHE